VPDEVSVTVGSGTPEGPTPRVPPLALDEGAAARLDEVVLEDVALPAEGQSLVVGVPADVRGLALVVSAPEDARVVLAGAVSPTGVVVVDSEPPADITEAERVASRGAPGPFFSDNRVLVQRELGSFIVPNTPDLELEPGFWALRLEGYTLDRGASGAAAEPYAGRVHLRVLFMREPAPAEGRIDLTLHFTGGDGLTASTAPEHSGLQAALTVAGELLAPAGLELGDVSYVDVAELGLSTVVLDEGCEGGDLDTLLSSSSVDDEGVHLFFVERFQCLSGGIDVGQGLGGMAGGLPGPPFVRGSLRSGVVVATGLFLNDPPQLGATLAHELGHFLGLFHTKENDLFGGPDIYDVISDTPDDEGAADNLMFFLIGDDRSLSEGQGAVLRASPWVRP
jgi:hypothetical protein